MADLIITENTIIVIRGFEFNYKGLIKSDWYKLNDDVLYTRCEDLKGVERTVFRKYDSEMRDIFYI